MNILAITQHPDLLERLRTAFEGAGHRVMGVPDPLRALACQAWSQAHVILVDAIFDPMDGYRFCNLLRAESRVLFRAMPIFIILDHPANEEDEARLREVEGDGLLESEASIQKLLTVLGPLLEGTVHRQGAVLPPLLACGVKAEDVRRLDEMVGYFGLSVRDCTPEGLAASMAQGLPAILFQGVEDPVAHEVLVSHRSQLDQPEGPYTILIGNLSGEGTQRKLLIAGNMDWLPLPLSAPLVLHGVRRALEWQHARRILKVFQVQIDTLVEQRIQLEMETSALRNEVLTDPLTELFNRRAFSQHLDYAIHQWKRHHRAFVLILGDVDYFKLINDRFGHMVGDKVLKGIASRIRAALRRSDLAFRIGGEEFAILLSETQLGAGLDVAEKIRRRIDETPITLDSGQCVFPTMSFGLGGPGEGDAAALFVEVDRALYAAKRKGRNRVETTESTFE